MGETRYRPDNSKDQRVAYTGTAGQSGAIQGTKVRLFATTDCFVKFGANPTAEATNMPLAAGVAEYFDFVPGEKISAVQSSSGGKLHIAVMEKKTAA